MEDRTAKYERVIGKLGKKYPLHFTIVGRNDGQDAMSLFEVIKERIASSSYAVFDATGGNANVSLGYGYAEGLEVPRAIFVSDHKAAQRGPAGSPIIELDPIPWTSPKGGYHGATGI